MEGIRNKSNGLKMILFAVLVFGILIMTMGISSASEGEPKYGGTLRIVSWGSASGFDVIKTRSPFGVGSEAAHRIMETLFDRGENGELIPVLGLSASPSADGKTWTIKLRQGVKFHDGTPFNADAVVFHWKRILDPKTRLIFKITIMPIISVVKTGDYEVQFNLKHAWLPFTSILTNPAGFVSPIPSPKAIKEGTQHRSPVGTGPFLFKDWKSGNRITLVKNPDYWQKGKPYLDGIVYLMIPDHESRYAALVSGQVDMIMTDWPTHVEKLTSNPEFSTHIVDYRSCLALLLNNTKPPLNDVRVRNAMALAWDQKKYIKANYKNTAPYTENWHEDKPNSNNTGYLHHDLKKARALMADYGKPVELKYLHTATSRGRAAGVIVQQMMKEIGIKVDPMPMDFSSIIMQLFTGQYDMTSWRFPGGYDMGPISLAYFHSKSPLNLSKYSSEEVDKLLVQQRLSTDPDARKKILNTVVQKVNSDSPFIILSGFRHYIFARSYVKNIKQPVPGEEGFSGTQFNIWLDK